MLKRCKIVFDVHVHIFSACFVQSQNIINDVAFISNNVFLYFREENVMQIPEFV